jgi:hypothetical protein
MSGQKHVRSAWDERRQLLEARHEAFNEVAKPLEPYIAVFVVFAAPAIVMSTTTCQSHSGASAVADTTTNSGSTDLTYGSCDVWCEFVLAFRSLGTVAVYLASRERRIELVAVGTTWRKLWTRVRGCTRRTPATYAHLAHDRGSEFEMDVLGEQHFTNDACVNFASADALAWCINERNIIKEKVLGSGAFGEVWSGRLQPEDLPVAVKFLFAGMIDDEGDPIDPTADEDFHKEFESAQCCSASTARTCCGFMGLAPPKAATGLS